MFFDSHAHLDDPRFSSDLDVVIARARDAGVCGIVTASQNSVTSAQAVMLADRYPGLVHAAVGIHPHEADSLDPRFEDWIQPLCRTRGVVAIGETGLDYHYDLSPRSRQKESFEAHIRMAAQTRLPLIVHCREAWPDCLDMLRAHRSPDLRGVAHCFSGAYEDAQALIELDFRISFAGNVTFHNADALRDVARKLPLDLLMIETDCPYLAPAPHRGRRNEPAFVGAVAAQIAELKSISIESVALATRRAAEALFGLA